MILKTPVTKQACVQSCMNVSLGRSALPSSGSTERDCLQKLYPVAFCKVIMWHGCLIRSNFCKCSLKWFVRRLENGAQIKTVACQYPTFNARPTRRPIFGSTSKILYHCHLSVTTWSFVPDHPAKRHLVWRTVSIVRLNSSGLCHCLAHNTCHCAKPFSTKLTWFETCLHKHQLLWQGKARQHIQLSSFESWMGPITANEKYTNCIFLGVSLPNGLPAAISSLHEIKSQGVVADGWCLLAVSWSRPIMLLPSL